MIENVSAVTPLAGTIDGTKPKAQRAAARHRAARVQVIDPRIRAELLRQHVDLMRVEVLDTEHVVIRNSCEWRALGETQQGLGRNAEGPAEAGPCWDDA